ncbi:hypothetical protein L1987_57405 [Smallanthus sonchifolius]|uniref:Uncharacterized protein n=1 Tax=Smallanthus sonchifolius TaxID=185202 RepID=A0ACB9DDJ1_9ASTR|nr:hypothetical protein L1987_57405 [Smallanthus sonchifolius]
MKSSSFTGEHNKFSIITFLTSLLEGDVVLGQSSMENLKKKRSEVSGDGRTSGKKIRSKKKRSKTSGEKIRSKKERSNGGDDAELEEFLAILKRFQAGYNHFLEKGARDCAGKSAVTPPATDSGSWNLAFELDDFNHDGLNVSAGDAPRNDTVIGFDLNADPVSDQKSD